MPRSLKKSSIELNFFILPALISAIAMSSPFFPLSRILIFICVIVAEVKWFNIQRYNKILINHVLEDFIERMVMIVGQLLSPFGPGIGVDQHFRLLLRLAQRLKAS